MPEKDLTQNIIAGSAGFHREGRGLHMGPVVRYALNLTTSARPNICLLPTASGDSAEYISLFYDACSREEVNASHLQFFPMPNHKNIEEHLLSQDLIWVGGGSVVNLLAIWKAHGLDKILRRAWNKGVVLGGISAGAICWSAGGTTDSFGPDLQPVTNEASLLPFACGVHYDSEAQRRPLFQKLIADRILPEGYATDDGVALHFAGTSLVKAITDTPGRAAYHVYMGEDGTVAEDTITPELLS